VDTLGLVGQLLDKMQRGSLPKDAEKPKKPKGDPAWIVGPPEPIKGNRMSSL
jgi:hypothetical protein